jgi:abequosyltransferase
MGSDDYVPEGAIGRILSLLGDEDIYLFGRTEANLRIKKIRVCYWLKEKETSQKFRFSSRSEIIRYFNACRRLGGLFSYLSSIVVKKSSWERIPFDESFIGTLYSHAFVLLAIVQSQGTLSYIKEPLVISRAGNDSFLTDWVRRGLIDLKGYQQLGTLLIPDIVMRRAFWGVMRYEHAPVNAIKSLAASGWRDWAEYKKIAHEIYLIPRWVTLVAEVAYPFSRLAYCIKCLYKKCINR